MMQDIFASVKSLVAYSGSRLNFVEKSSVVTAHGQAVAIRFTIIKF